MTAGKVKRSSISWEGNSLETLQGWPKAIRVDFGHSLNLMQEGQAPKSEVRPMSSIGSGIVELKESDDRAWYRVIYLSRINDVIYVLHCFEKKTRKTERRDLATAEQRLSEVRARLQMGKRDEKRRHGK
jgi:phage-related protein